MTPEFIQKRNQLSQRIFESTKGKISIGVWLAQVFTQDKLSTAHAGHIVVSILDEKRRAEHEMEFWTREFATPEECKNYLVVFIDNLSSVYFK